MSDMAEKLDIYSPKFVVFPIEEHPDGDRFKLWFQKLLETCTTKFERQVLGESKARLWLEWKWSLVETGGKVEE